MKDDFLQQMGLTKKTPEEVQFVHPLVLAYIGDAVYEVFVRNFILHKYGGTVNALHRISTKLVKAKAQAEIAHGLEAELTDHEWTIIKRGRNQKSGTIPKNANVTDYKYATGFETLIGYLYLLGQQQRLEEIIVKAIGIIEGADEKK